MLSRREVVVAAAGALAPGAAGYDALLEKVHRTDCEYAASLSNHAPMVMDALVAGGKPARLQKWTEAYLARMPPIAKLAAVEIPELGNYAHRGAWLEKYRADALKKPKELVRREWPLLVTGWSSAGWHGVIRVAHAVRALDRDDTKTKRLELAHALAYWAARHATLPGGVGGAGQLGVGTALTRIALVPKEQRRRGLIGDVLASVDGRPDFVASLAEVDLSSGKDPLGDLVAAAARMFVNAGGKSFTLLHAVTGTAALRLIQPWLDEKQFRSGLAAAFHAVAAARAAEGVELSMPAKAKQTADALLATALDSDDEHSIKLVEACVREHQLTGASELLSAAAAWLQPG